MFHLLENSRMKMKQKKKTQQEQKQQENVSFSLFANTKQWNWAQPRDWFQVKKAGRIGTMQPVKIVEFGEEL